MTIEIKNVSKVFQERSLPVQALSEISLSVAQGSFVALSGPSGSGKSTLLNLIGCLDRPTQGRILLDGEDVTELAQARLTRYRLRKIGFVFQDFNLIPTFTARENIEYVLWLQGIPAAERKKKVEEVARRFGIENLLERKPYQLSRGQQQRAAVARAIVPKPRIILGDELTANLDHTTGTLLMDFLKELNRDEGMTMLYASHDPLMIERADRIIKMQDGKILYAG